MSQCSTLKWLRIFDEPILILKFETFDDICGNLSRKSELRRRGKGSNYFKGLLSTSKFCSFKRDRRCKIKEQSQDLFLGLYLLLQIFQIKTMRFLVLSLSHPISWICCSNLVGHSLLILSNVRLIVFFCKYSSKIKIKEKLCLSDTSLGQSRKSLLTKICHFSIKYDVVALF